MSCVPADPTFRLLDHLVGWDQGPGPNDVMGIAGLDDPDGITLAPAYPGAARESDIVAFLPPLWLAPGCRPCEWYLATPAAAQDCARPILWSQLLHLDPCDCGWRSLWQPRCNLLPEATIAVVAVAGCRIAAADSASGSIALLDGNGTRLAARFACDSVSAMAFTPAQILLVAAAGQRRLLRFDLAGAALSPFAATLPADARSIVGMAVSMDETVWLAVRAGPAGVATLWKAGIADCAFEAAGLAELARALPARPLMAVSGDGFCIARDRGDGSVDRCCYSRYGRPVPADSVHVPAVPLYRLDGQLLTGAIDSGVPRCVWHRVQLDADIPSGTSVSLAIASAEVPGPPNPADWQVTPPGATDVLIRQPPGRYLYLSLALASQNGAASPRIRRIRLDFPRVTSLDRLPAVYRENPEGADFAERFLALFDASIADLDAAIERAPALLDAGGVPDDVLPWLARFLGLALDPAWEPQRSRAILRAIPELYRLRGTVAGLKLAFRLVFDADLVVSEQALERRWAGLGKNAILCGFRLFGRARSRAQIGRSALGSTVLKSFGDPAIDPLDALSWRVSVHVPPMPGRSQPPIALVQSLVDSQKPAHTDVTVRLGGRGFVLDGTLAVGVDTAFTALPPPILGRAGNIRLSRASFLRRNRYAYAPAAAGAITVGQQALME